MAGTAGAKQPGGQEREGASAVKCRYLLVSRLIFLTPILILGMIGSLKLHAQSTTPDQTNAGMAVNRSTVKQAVKITTGNTFQQILASNYGTTTQRQALTIENNNTNGDNCFIIAVTGQEISAGSTTSTTVTINGVALTAAQAAILLTEGGSYQRYWPYVPSDAIWGTCSGTGDSIYVDTQ